MDILLHNDMFLEICSLTSTILKHISNHDRELFIDNIMKRIYNLYVYSNH